MCGQCVLHSTGMTCPMTCPKTLRNGPCGGVREDGDCEVEAGDALRVAARPTTARATCRCCPRGGRSSTTCARRSTTSCGATRPGSTSSPAATGRRPLGWEAASNEPPRAGPRPSGRTSSPPRCRSSTAVASTRCAAQPGPDRPVRGRRSTRPTTRPRTRTPPTSRWRSRSPARGGADHAGRLPRQEPARAGGRHRRREHVRRREHLLPDRRRRDRRRRAGGAPGVRPRRPAAGPLATTLSPGTYLSGRRLDPAPNLFVGAVENAGRAAVRLPRRADRRRSCRPAPGSSSCRSASTRPARGVQCARSCGSASPPRPRSCRRSAWCGARALRFMHEHVPGIDVPAGHLGGSSRRATSARRRYQVVLEQARHALAQPGVRGVHITDFRHDDSVGRIVTDLGLADRRRPPPHRTRRTMHTVLRSPSKTVTIGADQPFCIIGERINPTGRKSFQEQLRAGDLSQLEADVAAAGGRRRARARRQHGRAADRRGRPALPPIRAVQALTDLPLCIDSSVVEALEAGLAAYEGKALVNSVTAEDERMELILPLVKKHGAAVIALPNDETGIPATAQERVELTGKVVSVATEQYGIPLEDIVIDPLAMTVGADPEAVVITLEAMRLIRERVRRQHDVRRVERVVRAAQPARAQRDLPAGRREPRPDQRGDGRAHAADRRVGAGRRPAARQGPVGRRLDRAPTARDSAAASASGRRAGGTGRCRPRPAPGRGAAAGFRPARTASGAVPAGTTVFDAASWNGIAVDSTCGGHGTCKKCKVRILDGSVPMKTLDVRAFTGDELAGGWRLACRAGERRPRGRGAAADDAAQGGHRRRRPAGHPAAGGAEAVRRARPSRPSRPGHRRRAAARRHRRPRADRRPRRRAHARPDAAHRRLQGHRRGRRRRADRRRAGRHDRAAVRHRLRPGHHHGRRDAAGPVDRHAARGAVDAEPAAAVRGRRHHAGSARRCSTRTRSAAARPRARDPGHQLAAEVCEPAGSTATRCTRWRSPAT